MTWNIRIGINPISWSNDDLPELGGDTPLETALREGAQIGYQGFELGNKFPAEPAALKGTLADEIAACRAHMAKLRFNDCKVVVYGEVAGSIQGRIDTPLAKRPHFASEAAWLAYAQRLDAFCAHLRTEYGLTLAYHH